MNELAKSPAQIAEERAETEDLRLRVLRATDGIPRHVMNGSQQLAALFKEHAAKARKMAEHKTYSKNLVKMRQAWNLISVYYRERP